MKKLYVLCFVLCGVVVLGQKNPKTIGFMENKGQVVDQKGKENKSVLYLLNTYGLNVQLRKGGFSYDIYETTKTPLTKKQQKQQPQPSFTELQKDNPDYSLAYKYHRIDIDFVGSNPNAILVTEGKSTDYDNYYTVPNAPRGVTGVHKYQKVTYRDIYNNIDVVFFIPKDSAKTVEYNFVVKPGGKISDIQMQFKGAKTVLTDNKIKMAVRFGEMEETLPSSWVENDKERKEIAVSYKKIRKDVYGFEGENASGKTVVIDPTPVRLWATYYADGSYNSPNNSISVDNFENVYYCGAVRNPTSTNMATSGAYQATINGQFDGYIAKFDAAGNRVWGTFVGGEFIDEIRDSKIQNNALVVVGGTTSYFYIATPGTHSQNYSPGGHISGDCYLMKFNLNGQRIWGTYFGGEGYDYPLRVTVDIDNTIIMTGETYSLSGISTPGSFKEDRTQPVNNNTTGEGFIVKFDGDGNRIWGTYFGICEIRSVGTDSNSNIYIAGDAVTPNNPISTPGTYQPLFSYDTQIGVGFNDSFLAKFNSNGQRIWGTYYGGYNYEFNHDLKVDSNNDIYISGYTLSNSLIATPHSHQLNLNNVNNEQNASDAYLAKFNPNGHIIWSTYYGGPEIENTGSYMLAVNSSNDVFLSGSSLSPSDIATTNTYSSNLIGAWDCFIAKFKPTGERIWGTYHGSSSSDFNTDMELGSNSIYISGSTYSYSGISTPGSYQPQTVISPGNFLIKFKDCQSITEVTSNSPVCSGSTIEMHATGGTNYSWTGPHGFVSTDPNPVINNASAVHTGLYTCTITGTGDCDGNASVNIVVGDTASPIPDLAALPALTGNCTTVTVIPTATDHCAGIITATTTDPLSYAIPGNYTIHWIYNDGNGNSSTQSQDVVITAVALPVLSSVQNFCMQDNATLLSIAVTGQNIQWYDSVTGGHLLTNTTALQNGITYYASQTVNGCESARVTVTVTIQNTPAPTGGNQSFCSTQNPTLADVIVAGTGIKWYATAISTNALAQATILTDGATYYATQTVNGCESVGRLAVTITLINTLNATDYSTTICDDLNDGSEMINIASYNTHLIANTANCTFEYYHSALGAENQNASDLISNTSNYSLSLGVKTIYVRVTSNNGCHQIVALKLEFVSKPIILISDIMPICKGGSITVDAGAGYDNYTWSTGETTAAIAIANPGNYSVTVSENHGAVTCSSVKNFSVVLSTVAAITQIISSDWTDHDNAITVHVTGSGDYEYSLDGVHYQAGNTFSGLESGEHIVYVRDRNGCGVSKEEVYLLMYPKFFTPNGDGFNDTWNITLSEKEANLTVKIFDRFGKLLKALDNHKGWNGTLNNQELPATDYWFTVTRKNGKEYRGHFALKR